MFLKRQTGYERHALKEAERHGIKRQRGECVCATPTTIAHGDKRSTSHT